MIDHAAIFSWYAQHERALPWRATTPYGVLVSEYMLQQTPVARVLPIWDQWMQKWPDVAALAAADRGSVLRMWGRLGYPRRAIRLHEAANIIVEEHDGEVPSDQEVLRTLPGVGEYTAAAIASFAFAQRAVVMDTNIRRLFARAVLGINAPSPSISRVERELALQLMPEKNAHRWAAATMELGALICTSRTPACEECPLKIDCQWRLANYPITIKTRGQAWKGSDRQCRGALMAALRQSPTPLSGSLLEEAWSDALQRSRCLDQLIREGLIEPLPDHTFALPT
jgi:A/G-specific adenine glycosylase